MKKMKPLKLTLLLVLISCIYNEPDSFNDTTFIDVVASVGSVAADGSTTTNLSIQLDENLEIINKEVTFETNLGTFSNGEKSISTSLDAFNKADAYLKSSTTGTASVMARIGAVVSESEEISFTEALADDLILNLNTLTHSNGINNKLTITATLLRSSGIPTSGLEVAFSASGTSDAVFRNETLSNANGVVTADFALNDTIFTGDVTITASQVKDLTVTGSEVLTITKQ